jgi:small subunit ribosomal protein S33
MLKAAARAFAPFAARQQTSALNRVPVVTSFSTVLKTGAGMNPVMPFGTVMSWRSAVFRGSFRSGSHYDNDSMINAKNPDLPKDPVLADIACRIFGTSPTSNPHARSVRKLLMKPLIGEAIMSYYPKYPKHNTLGYIDSHRVRAEEKLERLKRRGKGPPKKGQGKRAQKKK